MNSIIGSGIAFIGPAPFIFGPATFATGPGTLVVGPTITPPFVKLILYIIELGSHWVYRPSLSLRNLVWYIYKVISPEDIKKSPHIDMNLNFRVPEITLLADRLSDTDSE